MKENEIIRLAVHEAKTPIAVIYGYADLINYGIISGDELKKTAATIKNEAMRMAKMVDELAVFSGLLTNTIYAEQENVSLQEAFHSAATAVREKRKENADISISGNAVVKGDRELFRILMMHIMENGIIYNNNRHKIIKCNIADCGDKILITVDDNGMGISEEEIKTAFQCFGRPDKGKSRQKGCNGMGLTICRQIVHLYGGSIYIQGNEYGGTRVTVEL